MGVLGALVLFVLFDALFLKGKVRKWAWERIKKSFDNE